MRLLSSFQLLILANQALTCWFALIKLTHRYPILVTGLRRGGLMFHLRTGHYSSDGCAAQDSS